MTSSHMTRNYGQPIDKSDAERGLQNRTLAVYRIIPRVFDFIFSENRDADTEAVSSYRGRTNICIFCPNEALYRSGI